MSSFELIYFNSRGNGEIPRWLFAAAGQKFQDTRLEGEKWTEFKPSTPFGQLPVLKIDGSTQLCQSTAINQYVAKKFGFLGTGDIEEAQVIMVCGCLHDLVQKFIKVLFGSDEDKAKAKEAWEKEDEAVFLSKFEVLCGKNEGAFFVGNKMSLADVSFTVVSQIMDGVTKPDWTKYPTLAKCRDEVVQNPGIKEWIAKRPESQY